MNYWITHRFYNPGTVWENEYKTLEEAVNKASQGSLDKFGCTSIIVSRGRIGFPGFEVISRRSCDEK